LKKKINILYISLIFSLIILFNPILIERLLIRIDLAIYVILNNDLYGSEGSRLNSLYVMYEYLSSGTVTQFLFGEGFPYYADYLRRMFGSDPLLQYSDGAIFNTFAVVGISAGSIGLSIYLYLLNNIRKSKYIKTEYMIFFIILHFAYAGLQSYFLWSILLILKLNNTSRSFVESHRLIKKK